MREITPVAAGEHVNVDIPSDSLKSDGRLIMRAFLKGVVCRGVL